MSMSALPPNPAPAAPNNEATMATPAVDPSAVAPAVPMTAPAPAARNGAARPPVKPTTESRSIHYAQEPSLICILE